MNRLEFCQSLKQATCKVLLLMLFLLGYPYGDQLLLSNGEPLAVQAQAGPTLSVSMSVSTPQPVLSGNPILWEIGWQCSAVDATPCTGARIDVTKPLLTTNIFSAVGAPGFTTSAFIDGTGAHFIFIDPLPAGSSGTVQVQYTSENLHTPDGTILEPVATFSALNAVSVHASAGAEIHSSINLAITKRRLAAEEPLLDADVTYEINVFDSSWPNFTGPLPGTWTTENATVTDELPIGAVFISATDGGVYDAGTHMVTWPVHPEVAAYEGACTARIGPNVFCMQVTIQFPSAIFTSDNDPANTGDNVFNTAKVVAQPYGQPGGPDVTAQANAVHGFIDQPILDSIISKNSGTGLYVRGGNEAGTFFLLWQNRSNVPVMFATEDRLPCPTLSPTGPLTPCQDLGIHINRITFHHPILNEPITVEYTTNDGNTGTMIFDEDFDIKRIGDDDVVPRTLNPGEFISHFTVSGYLASGFSQRMVMFGSVAPDFPDEPTTEIDIMTNCIDNVNDFGEFGGIQNPENVCRDLRVGIARPRFNHFKNGTGLGAIAPTESRTFSLSINPCIGEAPWNPVITDLLPPNMRYVDATQSTNYASIPSLNQVPPTFEVFENVNVDGSQLLRWSWPGGESIDNAVPCTGLSISFDAEVEPGALTGTFTNRALFFDAIHTNDGTPETNYCGIASEADVEDLDMDQNASEYRCVSLIDYTVIESASMIIRKEVRGSLDTDFQAPPAVGLVTPGSPADYRITLQNTGNVNLTGLVAYDVLPFFGDTGVSGTQLGVPRNSAWQPVLAGAVTPPAGGTVEYSLDPNPCRGEVITQGGILASGPAGCVNDWTTTPADFALVRALRISVGDTELAGGEERSVLVPMIAPAGVDGIAWNTAALAGQRADSETWLLPTEPPKVGLAVPIDLALTKSVDPAASASPGTELTYMLEVTNQGQGNATEVEVTDMLPASLIFESADPAGNYDNITGLWNVGDLASGDTASLALVATVNAGTEGTTITNYAQVSAANEQDADSTPGNNTGPDPVEDDEASASIFVVVLEMSLETSNVSCFGGQDGTISVTASGSAPPYSYSNDGGVTFQGSNTFIDLGPGAYTMVVMDADGNTIESEVEITEPTNIVCTGRITGGGKIVTAEGTKVSHGFELHCDLTSPNNLQINWNKRKFHLTQLEQATCSDEPGISEGRPVAGFDTFVGSGVGRLDGIDGARIEFTLTDAGEPGKHADLSVFSINDGNDLNASGRLTGGNHQTHADTPKSGSATRHAEFPVGGQAIDDEQIFLPHIAQ